MLRVLDLGIVKPGAGHSEDSGPDHAEATEPGHTEAAGTGPHASGVGHSKAPWLVINQASRAFILLYGDSE